MAREPLQRKKKPTLLRGHPTIDLVALRISRRTKKKRKYGNTPSCLPNFIHLITAFKVFYLCQHRRRISKLILMNVSKTDSQVDGEMIPVVYAKGFVLVCGVIVSKTD